MENKNGWRIRTMMNCRLCIENHILYCNNYKRRLEWTGHLVRMADDRTVKKVLLRKPGRRRRTGRPKLMYLDCTENDLKSVGVKRWRKKAEDRFVWAVIRKEVLVKL
jgi:hypothetical protein